MITPKNIISLYEKNTALLDKMGFEVGKDDPLSLCSPEAYRSTGLFSEDMVHAMFDDSEASRDITETVVDDQIGMILIRPDMLHAVNEFESYITDRFELLQKEYVPIDVDTYWEIYRHDLYRRQTMHSSLTRAVMYIGATCCLMVFRSPTKLELPLADTMRSKYRGNQGEYKVQTLRGDIVYRNAVKLGLHHLIDIDPRIPVAVDPFGSYRSLVRKPDCPAAHLPHPLLFYTGVGVHVPDYKEIQTDLPVLSSDSSCLSSSS